MPPDVAHVEGFLLLSSFISFWHPDSNLIDGRPSNARQKYKLITDLILGWCCKTDTDVLPTPPLDLTGLKCVKFALDFRPKSHLTHSSFEIQQHPGNLKHPPGVTMIGLFVSEIVLIPRGVYPPRGHGASPKMAGWAPNFFIIMHLKCCADRWHDLPVLWQSFWNQSPISHDFGSQIINEYYDDTNNGRMADW